MLKIDNISKFFDDKQVLSNITLQVEKGCITALLGENGAGKSTLLRILSGYFEADTGSVMLDELNLKTNRIAYLRNIGYVQEISALYGEMNVYDFLHFVAAIRQITPQTATIRINDVIEQLQLKEVLAQKCENLSKGFKKRTELAAVLLAEPEVLLLDEPTEGLDPNQKDAIRKIIKKYARNHLIIISTHTLEDVEAMADKILLLHQGKLLFDGTLSDFKKKSRNDLSASFRIATQK